MREAEKARGPERCNGVTATGRACRRRAVGETGYCRQHGTAAFYARVLTARDRTSFEEALAQEGLAGEVAVLRLHLLRLLGRDDPERPAEIPRTVHALVRALRDARDTDGDPLAIFDAAVREEGADVLDLRETAPLRRTQE